MCAWSWQITRTSEAPTSVLFSQAIRVGPTRSIDISDSQGVKARQKTILGEMRHAVYRAKCSSLGRDRPARAGDSIRGGYASRSVGEGSQVGRAAPGLSTRRKI